MAQVKPTGLSSGDQFVGATSSPLRDSLFNTVNAVLPAIPDE
jgi:hypothetical protein